MIASRIARPLTPTTLLITVPSLMLASSSVFWMRWVCCASSWTSCLRVRVKSRSACTAGGGTKRLRINPWAKRSAIHAASVTSLFRPGTFRMWAAFASTSSKASPRTCQTGFQYRAPSRR